jgi:hypothetical protein
MAGLYTLTGYRVGLLISSHASEGGAPVAGEPVAEPNQTELERLR